MQHILLLKYHYLNINQLLINQLINHFIRSEFPGLKQKKKLTRQLSYLPSLVPEEEKEDWEAIEKKNKEEEQEIIESDTKKFNESAVISFNLSEAVAFSAVKVNINLNSYILKYDIHIF